MGRRRVSPRRTPPSLVSSRASKKSVLDISSEARTSEILCKPKAGTKSAVGNRLVPGLSAVYQQDEKRSLFLAADQWTETFCLCKPFLCKACPGIYNNKQTPFQSSTSRMQKAPFQVDKPRINRSLCFPVSFQGFLFVSPWERHSANHLDNNSFGFSRRPVLTVPTQIRRLTVSRPIINRQWCLLFLDSAGISCGGRGCRRQIPGHTLYEKGFQGQKSDGPLVSSQEHRSLSVPLINCG